MELTRNSRILKTYISRGRGQTFSKHPVRQFNTRRSFLYSFDRLSSRIHTGTKLKASYSSTNVNPGCTNLTSINTLPSLFTTPLVPVLVIFVQTCAKPPSSETHTLTELYFYGTIYRQMSNHFVSRHT